MKNNKLKEYKFKENIILSAAKKLFFEYGFERTTMKEIANEAGYTRKTIYSYFNDKVELIYSIYNEGLRERVAIIDKFIKKKESGIDKILAFGDAYYNFFKKYPIYIKLQMYWISYTFNYDDIRESILIESNELNKRAIKILRDSLVIGIEDGTIRKDVEIDYTLFHIIGSFQSILGETIITNFSARNKDKSYFSKKKGTIDKQYFYKFVELLLKGLRA